MTNDDTRGAIRDTPYTDFVTAGQDAFALVDFALYVSNANLTQ
jgi:hypothetical protein